MKTDWNPEVMRKLIPERRHFEWLDHEARFHRDPVAQQIIREIKTMLQPALFMEVQRTLGEAFKAIQMFRESQT